MNSFQKLSVCAAMSLLLIAPYVAVAEAGRRHNSQSRRPPNIIFILVDDLGWSELGSYGNRFNSTPHLDRLAAEGMRFTNAYAASPVCSPTRAALMTGQHPARIGITGYLDVHDRKHLSPSYTTLNEPLEAAGYTTGLIGKWHLTGDYSVGRGAPERHGWDEVIGSERKYIADGDYFFPYFFLPELKERQPDEYLTDRLNLEAVDFIRRHKERPFFLYLSHYSVHTKLEAKDNAIAKYAAKPDAGENKNNPQLAAMLESIDDGIGRITSTLDDLKLADDTLIVFTSDNGGETRVTTNAPLRGGKSQLYEGGIREPLIVRYPRLVRANSVSDAAVVTMDFYPTLIELAGAPRDRNQALDGVSFAARLKDTKAKDAARADALVWYYPLDKPHFLGGRSSMAIRAGDYKLIEFFDKGSIELYDLKSDPGEQRDLARTMPAKTAMLRRRLNEWRARTITRAARFD